MIIVTTQCFPPDRGGIETLMGGLADTLSGAGHEVMVFADRIRTNGAHEPSMPYAVKRFGGLRPLRRRFKARAVAVAARTNAVEGIFADSWKSTELLPVLKVPLAVLVHGTEIPIEPSASKRARIARSLARAHAVVVNSAYTAGAIEPYLSDGNRRIRIVHPPIGAQIEPSAQALAAAREIVHASGPVLLTVARLEPRKGIDMAIRAMPDILAAHPGAVYVVAGPGDDLARLRQLARDEGVSDQVRFIGPVDGEVKAAFYALADVFVMPARRIGNSVESFGIVYVEAGWYGVPSIGGRDGGAGDAVGDGVTGLLCDSFNSADVARTILRLLDDADLRRTLGAAAAERARGAAQWAQSLPRYLAALR